MKKGLFLAMLMCLTISSCTHKDLSDTDGCNEGNTAIKVVENWEDPSLARVMRINIFSVTSGVSDYGRDNVPVSGVKYINLYNKASYWPITYDYEAKSIYFRNETTLETFQAYFAGATRATYEKYVEIPTRAEATVSSPANSEFYAHGWDEPFYVNYVPGVEQVIDFYPKNLLREFTYRVNNIQGASNISEARGAITGMASTYFFYTNSLTDERSTLLFDNARFGTDAEKGYGYIEGEFYTFGPVHPYVNWFTLEILATNTRYYTASWNVSDQVTESMEDRPAKLARDGYDILIWNEPDGGGIPEIPDPENTGPSSGFEIGVGDWDNIWVPVR